MFHQKRRRKPASPPFSAAGQGQRAAPSSRGVNVPAPRLMPGDLPPPFRMSRRARIPKAARSTGTTGLPKALPLHERPKETPPPDASIQRAAQEHSACIRRASRPERRGKSGQEDAGARPARGTNEPPRLHASSRLRPLFTPPSSRASAQPRSLHPHILPLILPTAPPSGRISFNMRPHPSAYPFVHASFRG